MIFIRHLKNVLKEREKKNKTKQKPKKDKDIQKKRNDYDDYGNTKTPPRTYTEEEVNERINKAVRERLSRGDNTNQQPTQQQVVQQAQGFEYNPDSEESWEGQLEKFVRRTVSKDWS